MDLKLPNLGEGADSGTVVNIFVKEGDQITKDQPILELENEKAVATIPASGAGTITKIYVKPGDKLSVGQRLVSLGDAPGAVPPPQPAPTQAETRAADRDPPAPRRSAVWENSEPSPGPRADAQQPPRLLSASSRATWELIYPTCGERPGGPDCSGGCARVHPTLQRLAASPSWPGPRGWSCCCTESRR